MKKLIIISFGYNTGKTIYDQLNNLFAASLDIKYYFISSPPPHNFAADLVLFSGKLTYDKMKHLIGDRPYIIARRSINYHEINKLFKLPRYTDALLVNDTQESAEETIFLLQALGIDHINLSPYYPGIKEFPRLSIAVTPGEVEHVPPFVNKIIDIKTRLVDITSIVEILAHFDMLEEFAHILSTKYIQDIIKLIKTGNKLLNDSNNMKERFKTVINNVHDGLIAINKENKVSVFNPVAEQLFDKKSLAVTGQPIENVLDSELLKTVDNPRKEGVLKLHSHEILVSEMPLYTKNTDKGRLYVLKDVSEIHRLEESVRRRLYQEQNIARYQFTDIVGNSPALKNTLALARKMAKSDATIFIQGESGTGKELLAQSIHNASARSKGPFVAINFAALSETLLESELFGYVEGSFTGEKKGGASGLFEAAHKGTLFLDEIGDAPLPFQVKLLRVLQERQIRRVGSIKIIPIDVRIIVATNHNLKEDIKLGLFREDLYYRLNVLPLKVPPLRQRREDIMPLCYAFYKKYKPLAADAETFFKNIRPFLEAYNWQGNIRELQNIIEYLINICPDTVPQGSDLPEDMKIQLFTDSAKINIKEEILAEIKRCNVNRLPVGRRSLAAKFTLPENKIREILLQLQNENKIIITAGKYGLKAIDLE